MERLFKDITNGTLRRKRGADYDLSDSDDDGEARRAMKRREFARMRKALLEGNEDIGKIGLLHACAYCGARTDREVQLITRRKPRFSLQLKIELQTMISTSLMRKIRTRKMSLSRSSLRLDR